MSSVISIYEQYQERSQYLLPVSANVDIFLFLLKLKPFLRTRFKSALPNLLDNLRQWSLNHGFSFAYDGFNSIYMAWDKKVLEQIITLDQSFDPHEIPLGLLLGYPHCCCEKIAQLGESGIDDFEAWLSHQEFEGAFKLINPSKYVIGNAFISHVPCSTTCVESLHIAHHFANFLQSHKIETCVQPWITELGDLGIVLNNLHNSRVEMRFSS